MVSFWGQKKLGHAQIGLFRGLVAKRKRYLSISIATTPDKTCENAYFFLSSGQKLGVGRGRTFPV